MSINIEKVSTMKISAKGILKRITNEGIHIEDIKEGIVEVLTFKELEMMIGKEVTITFNNKEFEAL